MKILLNKYTPTLAKLNYLADQDAIVIAPLDTQKKYEKYLMKGNRLPKIIYLEDYTLPKMISIIRESIDVDSIEEVLTLDEHYMWHAGFLNDYFKKKNSSYLVNSLFQDKYLMRSVLFGIVPQPMFRLIETQKDIELFWKNTAGDKSIIKPRFGAACVGIKKYSRGEQIPEKFINSQYIIEEYVDLQKMLTCDGYSQGSNIIRFYSHEYEELLLGTIGTSNEFTVRTNSLYEKNIPFLRKIFSECSKVLKEFVNDYSIIPFHFEWFFDENKGEFVFCEVGKRFGGGDIPNLIQRSFGVNIFEEFWGNVFDNKGLHPSTDLERPKFISATYCPYKKRGKLVSAPDMELFEWTDEIYVFSKVGEESDGITSVVEGDFIAIIVSETEEQHNQKLSKLRELSEQFIWEERFERR